VLAVEKEDHLPFAKLLNETFQTARSVLGTSAGCHYESLRFSTYHRPTGDRVSHGGARSLKPDLVGCDEDIQDDQTVYWRSIRIPVEVNAWFDMVAKAHCITLLVRSASCSSTEAA
jgi:hypothetical protein